MKKGKSNVLALLVTVAMVVGLFPVAAFAESEENDYLQYGSIVEVETVSPAALALLLAQEELFADSREIVTRTFPAAPHILGADEWWRMVQLATINEPVPGANFAAPAFVAPAEITPDNAANTGATILSMVAMGVNPRDFGGRNLVHELVTLVNNSTDDIIPGVNSWLMPQIFYAITAANAVSDIHSHVIDELLGLQGSEGGWAPWAAFGMGPDIEATAQLIVMLEPFSARDARVVGALAAARAFIAPLQMDCGGFPQGDWLGAPFGVETTARVMEAIAALGECPLDWTVDGDITLTPIHALLNEMSPNGTFVGAQSMQAHIGIATVGLRVNPFTNLRNPRPFVSAQIPLSPDAPVGSTPLPPPTPLPVVSIIVSDTGGAGVKFQGNFTPVAGETAYSLLRRTGLSVASRSTDFGVYVYGIGGLREFDAGPLSGWMFNVNGSFPGAAADRAVLSDGDSLAWLFTRDLGADVGGGGGFLPPVLPPVRPPVADEKIEFEVMESVAVVITAASTEATSMEINLSIEFIAEILNYELPLTILSEVANISLDAATLEGLIYGADSDAIVSLAVEKTGRYFTLTLMVDGEFVREFEGVVTVTFPYEPTEGFFGLLTVFHLDDYGNITEMEDSFFHEGLISFTTTHFSRFFVGERVAEAYEEIQFVPAQNVTVTRAMAVEMLWRLVDSPVEDVANAFTDVSDSAAIDWAYANRIVFGFGDGTFRPNEFIVREHFANILRNYYAQMGAEIDAAVLGALVGGSIITYEEALAILQGII
ncbi:MAG: DUF4430 domain-containing protein [Defluviitaleaceae bacterium]|nr:DUF4430 domain-containing protein [Defluviitaleaceae bacterium]